ncbi:MAG: 2-polyprenylphenol 6-hydroxylase, partial [Rhabdaerophilum calidifontis]
LARLARRDAGRRGTRIVAALTRLGPSYVKLGQFLATRPDLVGMALARDLEALQDRMPPFPQAVAEARVAAALGRPVATLFTQFGPPVAAASIAQVHRAEILVAGERRPIAVKITRPGIERVFTRDIAAQKFMAGLVARLVPAMRRLKPVEVVETLERTVRLEMDLRFEAAALSEMGDNTRDDPDFRVPAVEWGLTARDCVTLEWIDGIKLNDFAGLDAASIDRRALARVAMQSFLRHALRDGFFHADMHPGNLFATHDGTLVAVDLGIMGRLGRNERRFLAEILFGFITRDYRRIAEVHFEAGYVPPVHAVEDFAQALRAVGERIHGRSAAEISMAELLGLLFEITAIFDMATRTELVLLQKTMVVVEGVSRGLDPEFDMWKVSEPIIRAWIERNLGPVGRVETAGREVVALLDAAREVPALVARAKTALAAIEARPAPAPAPSGLLRILTIGVWLIALTLVMIMLGIGAP